MLFRSKSLPSKNHHILQAESTSLYVKLHIHSEMPKKAHRGRGGNKGKTRHPKSGRRSAPSHGNCVMVNAVRNIHFAPHPTTAQSVAKTSWLSSLSSYGVALLRLLSTTMAALPIADTGSVDLRKLSAANPVITGALQVIYLGLDDLLTTAWPTLGRQVTWKPSNVQKTVEWSMKQCIFRQGRMNRIQFSVTPSSEASRRGGRYAINATPIAQETAQYLRENLQMDSTNGAITTNLNNRSDGVWHVECITFDQLCEMPGTRCAPNATPIKFSINLPGWTSQFHELGQRSIWYEKDDKVYGARSMSMGGLPLIKVIFGYSDYASSDADPSDRYSPEEATFDVAVSARIGLRSPLPNEATSRWTTASAGSAKGGRVPVCQFSILRESLIQGMDSSKVSIMSPTDLAEVDLKDFASTCFVTRPPAEDYDML